MHMYTYMSRYVHMYIFVFLEHWHMGHGKNRQQQSGGGGRLTSSRARAAGGAKLPPRLLGGTKALPAEGLAGASSRSFFCKGTCWNPTVTSPPCRNAFLLSPDISELEVLVGAIPV